MSPVLKIEVKNATYNETTHELFLEVVQEFHIRYSPLPVAPSRSITFSSFPFSFLPVQIMHGVKQAILTYPTSTFNPTLR